ncbi:MAG TPA: glutamate 5-kinase [Candidatus Eisenbacteria bacterium]|nr:glutamate 5-kinase [Candidatus Eisenbacteria bacterium]
MRETRNDDTSDDHTERDTRQKLSSARRVVIKLGTSTVTDAQGGICAERVDPIVRFIAALMREERQVVLVSSGAVGLGRSLLGLHPSRLKDMAVKQACAAAGQSLLMESYQRRFDALEQKVAQVLLTEEDFSNWNRYSNLRRTMEKLLGFGVLPIVNENDTVSTAELESVGRQAAFSDNDRLAALVMSGLEADALVLVTNVDGFLQKRAGAKQTELVPFVERVTPQIKVEASGPSQSGRGGMTTKIEAAEIAMNCGGVAVIVNGRAKESLERVFVGERVGTVFAPATRMRGKRRWLAYAAGVRGRVVVDAGAQRAITAGKASLLNSGVVRVEREFGPMDVVSILDLDGREFARGIAACSSGERNSDGKKATRVIFSRENIVLLEGRPIQEERPEART